MFGYKKLVLAAVGLFLLLLMGCQLRDLTVPVGGAGAGNGESAAGPANTISKELVICMAHEPATLYPYGGTMLAQVAVQHAIFENDFTSLSFDYQAAGLVKLPSLADGDAVIEAVEVREGDNVIVAGEPKALAVGDVIVTAADEEVVFDGTPVSMAQMVVAFEMKPRIWADGEPVKASDSVYSFHIHADPATPESKYQIERTASYEATGELTTRWTGIPGYKDSTYFTNFWKPLPEHAWKQFTAAELLEAEESNRRPLGDGAFKVSEWRPGEAIILEKNEHYYRADEGLPYLDTVTIKFVPDTNNLIAQLIAGQCDIGTQDGMDIGQAPFLLRAEDNGLLTTYFETGTIYEHIDFGINSYGGYGDDIGRPDWFEDARVRQAITMCTDRQSMVDNILYGQSEVIHTYIPRVHPLYPEGELTEWPYDVEAANALLDEVGYIDVDGDGIREYTDGTPFSITLGTTTAGEMRTQLTQIFKENMLQCGIDVHLYYLPASDWFAQEADGPLFGRQFDLGEFAWITSVEPSCKLYLSSQTTGPVDEINPHNGLPYAGWGGANVTGWHNEAFDRFCTAAISSLPGTPEYEENHKAAQIVFSEEVPVLPLFLRLKVAVAGTNVLNFNVDPTQGSELYNIYELDLASK